MKPLSKQAVEKLQNANKNLPNVDETELKDSPKAANDAIEILEEVQETSFFDETGQETQKLIPKREYDGVKKAMTSVRDNLSFEVAKLNETNKDIARNKEKLEQARANNDEFQIERIRERLTDLELERSARLEVISINREKLRTQVNRIKETIHRVLNEDTTLAERIKTLFREQGITIASILTAFGMTIGVIVEAFTGGSGTNPTPTPKPSPSPKPPNPDNPDSVKEWIKKTIIKFS